MNWESYRMPAGPLNIYSNTTAHKHSRTETHAHVRKCKSVSLHTLGDIKQAHSAKGMRFHQSSDLSAPCTPTSAHSHPVYTHSHSPWHSCTHHDHGNTHDAAVQVMHEWEEKSWGNYLSDMAGERAIKAWGCGKVVRDVHALHPQKGDTAGGV